MTDKLKVLIKDKESITDYTFNQLFRMYVYECFLMRLSKSKYNKNFILKGGYLLSHIFYNMSRFTHDIDFELKNMNLDEDKINNIINEIISINLNDEVSFEISSIDTIKDIDEYSGFRLGIKGNVGKSIESFSIDIATGDVITPKEVNAKLSSTVTNEIIEISVYNNSTIIAEKIETIISKSDLNSRMKDYYDIYNFYILNLIDYNELKLAFKNTFQTRNNNIDLIETMSIISSSKTLQNYWNSYSKTNKLDLSFDSILEVINIILDKLFPLSKG